jgi:hypothetical protein
MHASAEVYGEIQDLNSLVEPAPTAPPAPQSFEESRFLAGNAAERTSYAAVPPITPDFFARSAGKARR